MAKKAQAPFAVTTGRAPAKAVKPIERTKAMTVRLPIDLHMAWKQYLADQPDPEDFQAFVIRKVRQHLNYQG